MQAGILDLKEPESKKNRKIILREKSNGKNQFDKNKALLDSEVISFIMSSEFARKKRFKIKRPIYVRNIDRTFIKERPIKHTVKINIYYQRHKERTEIDVIGGQKWNIILGMPWIAYHNPEID